MKKFYYPLLGIVTGFANGLFGSGGGILAVPMLEKADTEPRKAHATSLALTLPLSVVSACFYYSRQSLRWSEILPLIPAGLVGAVLGGIFLKKIPSAILKRIFGGILIISGIRMLTL